MKKLFVLASMLLSVLLVAAFSAAEVADRLDYNDESAYRFTRYLPAYEQKYQRLLSTETANYFPFDGLNMPQTQRIIDVGSLDIEIGEGDLATPGIMGAQRVLDPRYAFAYGYDPETTNPLLSPYGEKRVLKARGYGTTPIALDSAMPMQTNKRLEFRATRQRTMQRWLARQYSKLPVIRKFNPYQLPNVQGLDNLDMRPIFLDQYERFYGSRDLHSNIFLRQRFLASLPGMSYSDLHPFVGDGEMRTEQVFRQQFLAREGVGSDLVDVTVPVSLGEGGLEADSNVLLLQRWNRIDSTTGNSVYDRYDWERKNRAVVSEPTTVEEAEMSG